VVTFTVKTIGSFKEIIGTKEIELSLEEGITLKDLLIHMTERWGDALESKLFEPGTATPFPYIRLMVNGQDIAFLNRMQTVIKEGDEVLILPPAYGG
jgi:MoaD family protein